MDCNCPAPTSLLEIVAEACKVNLKQIQRLGFQRTQTTAPFTAVTILLLATWQGFMTAADDTKIVVTPILGGEPVIEAGEKITTGGGDNSTMNGIEELEGVNPSNFSALFRGLSSAVEKQIKALICEKSLTVYLFLEGGRIACVEITGTPNTYKGFQAQSVFLSDRNNAGFAAQDTHNLSFGLPAGWSEDLAVIKPTDFNPVLDL